MIKNKPSVLLMEEDYHRKQSGLKMLQELFIDEMGFDMFTLKSLVL